MATITEIEKLIAAGRLDDARDEIERLLEAEPQNPQAWFLLGGIYRRHELWGDAINAYNRAKLIEPEGPAAAAIESIYDIIRFVNTDLMNPLGTVLGNLQSEVAQVHCLLRDAVDFVTEDYCVSSGRVKFPSSVEEIIGGY